MSLEYEPGTAAYFCEVVVLKLFPLQVLLERGADKRVLNRQGVTVGEMVLSLSQLK